MQINQTDLNDNKKSHKLIKILESETQSSKLLALKDAVLFKKSNSSERLDRIVSKKIRMRNPKEWGFGDEDGASARARVL